MAKRKITKRRQYRDPVTKRFISKQRWEDQKKARLELQKLGFIEPKKYRKPKDAPKDATWRAWKVPPPTSYTKEGEYHIYTWRFAGNEGYRRAVDALRTLAAKHSDKLTRVLFGTGKGEEADWASTKLDKANIQFQHLSGVSKSQSGQQLLQRGREDGEPLYFIVQMFTKVKIRISNAQKRSVSKHKPGKKIRRARKAGQASKPNVVATGRNSGRTKATKRKVGRAKSRGRNK